jgi:hypothetical protein
VAHTLHQFAQRRALVGRELVAGMPQVVEVNRRNLGLRDRPNPDLPEVLTAKSAALRTDEHTAGLPRLHAYYKSLGFRHVRTVDAPGRMSGALFELDISRRRLTAARFEVSPREQA